MKSNSEQIREARENNRSLTLKPSGITGDAILHDASETVSPGNGVFTTHAFPKGEFITYYTGWIINYAEFTQLQKHNAHSHLIGRTPMRDAVMGVETAEELLMFPEDERGLGSFINHSPTPNCEKIIIDEQICFKALVQIPANSEIFINYGSSYWQKTYVRDPGANNFRQLIIRRGDNTTRFLTGKRKRNITHMNRKGGRRRRRCSSRRSKRK